MSYVDIAICVGLLPILETWPPIYRGQERTARDRLKVSQVLHHVYFRYTPCLTDFTFDFIRRPISPILSPSHWTFVELTLVNATGAKLPNRYKLPDRSSWSSDANHWSEACGYLFTNAYDSPMWFSDEVDFSIAKRTRATCLLPRRISCSCSIVAGWTSNELIEDIDMIVLTMSPMPLALLRCDRSTIG
jgi:hypothetical protein